VSPRFSVSAHCVAWERRWIGAPTDDDLSSVKWGRKAQHGRRYPVQRLLRRRSDFFVIHVPPYLKCAPARQEERTQFLLLNILVTSCSVFLRHSHCSTINDVAYLHASSQDAAGQRARWRARRARQMYKNYSDTQISTRPWLGVGRHVCRCRSAALLLLLTYLLAWGWALTSRQHEIQQSRFRFLQITDLEAGSMAMMTGDDWR
jgi:hypothetical protein